MKLERLVPAQNFLLVLAVIAGVLLKDDLSDGPRLIHRLSGQFAGLLGIVIAVRVMQLKSPKSWKILAWTALAATFFAGFSGLMLKETSNYDMTFTMMRFCGACALVLNLVLFLKVVKPISKK